MNAVVLFLSMILAPHLPLPLPAALLSRERADAVKTQTINGVALADDAVIELDGRAVSLEDFIARYKIVTEITKSGGKIVKLAGTSK